MKRLGHVLKVIVPIIILFFLTNYFYLIPLNIRFTSAFNLFFWLLILTICAYYYQDVKYLLEDVSKGKMPMFPKKRLGVLFGLLGVVYVTYHVASSPILFSEDYRTLIGDIETKDFNEEIPQVDLAKIPVVDEAYARRLGDKLLGEDVGLGSQVYVGDYTLISMNDELYWVAPLEHAGIVRWLFNREGTPGYIMVSATDAQDVRLVQEDANGEPINLKYLPSAYFGEFIERKVYYEGNMTVGLTDYSFELDDTGRPYWVVTMYDKKVGLTGGADAIGVVIVDAQTGETVKYSVEETPTWVDRIQPAQFVNSQLNDWGLYVNGYINTLFAKREVLQTTTGMNYMYLDGEWYFYTGMTSIGADESTVGFLLTNTRSKETTFYKVAGATELAAMSSAEGKVQNLGYNASFPLLLNVEGAPTYFMTLKDNQGLVKQYAFVNVRDYSVVGTGEMLTDARSNYTKILYGNDDFTALPSGERQTVTSTVERIGMMQVDGNTVYTLILTDYENLLFTVSHTISPELAITREGDTVEVEYIDSESMTKNILQFNNKMYEQQ